jgi:hypothetical protein
MLLSMELDLPLSSMAPLAWSPAANTRRSSDRLAGDASLSSRASAANAYLGLSQSQSDADFNWLLGGVWPNSMTVEVWNRVQDVRRTAW